MKQIIAFMLVLLLAAVSAGEAKACDRPMVHKRYGVQKGEKSVRGDQEKNLEGTVEVAFKIDGTGKVEIININATSPQLADYVIKKLNKIQLERGDPQIGQIIKYRFVFKKQV